MTKKIMLLIFCFGLSLTVKAEVTERFMVKKSQYSVTKTLDRLETILKQKGITIFARVNHAEGARRVGLKMPETQLLIFGNPKMGTPLMNEQILMGLDLPMKVLCWKDKNNQTWLAYTKASELQARHGLKNQALLDKMSHALNAMTNKALEKQTIEKE